MPSLTPEARRLRRAKLVAALDLGDDDARWLDAILAATQRDHAARAWMLQGSGQRIRRYLGPEAIDRWQTVAKHIPIRSPFAWIPYEDWALAMAAQATLFFPAEALRPALSAAVRTWGERLDETPLMKIARRAFRDDFESFLVLQVKDSRRWQNFGRADAERIAPRHFRIHYDDRYAELERHLLPPLFVGVLRCFGLDGEAAFELEDSRHFTIELRWS